MNRQSPRHQQQEQQQQQQQQQQLQHSCPVEDPAEENVIMHARAQSLYLDLEQWSRPLSTTATAQVFPDTQYGRTQNENKREGAYSRMAEREMVAQVNLNPFLADHSYVDDLKNQDTFIHPHTQ